MNLALCAKIEEIERISGSNLRGEDRCGPCVVAHISLDYSKF